MQYENIILELMSRIKALETQYDEINKRIILLENDIEESDDMPLEDETAAIRQKMTPERIEACYSCARKLHENKNTTFGHEINLIIDATDMNRNSAIMYVHAARSMMTGKIYKRAISQPAVETFLNNIYRDFGNDGLKMAVTALRLHILYRQKCGQVVDGLIKLCSDWEQRIPN